MNKSQEIAALNQFADSLPKDSYLANWLHYALPEIAKDISCDLFPTVLPTEARVLSQEILKQANEVLAEANRKAEQIGEQANEKARQRGNSLERQIGAAVDAARGFIRNAQEV